MHSANQDDPRENHIRMLVLHSLFFPDDARKAESREALSRMVSEDPSRVERVVLAYAKTLLQVKDVELGPYEKMIDGRRPCAVFDADQEGRLLVLLRDVRREARETRLSRIRDRGEISWAKKHAKERGTPISLSIH